MIYNDFKGKKISALGLGCMRLPTKGKNDEIDTELTAHMLDFAMSSGINYYDTAWVYHGGTSESVMGELFAKYPRESFYLATKFPGFDKEKMSKVREIFEEQLRRCKVDYFDFYLFHSVTEENIDGYLDPTYGIADYLNAKKKEGKIRHLGFSTHGTLATMKRFLDAYADILEFCQLQINWLDWIYQDARAKVELVKSYGLPVFVMEPVRGGKLCRLDKAYTDRLEAVCHGRSLPEWAFRFIQGIPEVTMTLSGMSDMAQLKQNTEIYSERKPLSDGELAALMEISREMSAVKTVPCTSCRYCTEQCPVGLDIPWLIDLYNESNVLGRISGAEQALAGEPKNQQPSACIACRSCEGVCPQGIKISSVMSDFKEKLAR